jgi:hypothetical protein
MSILKNLIVTKDQEAQVEYQGGLIFTLRYISRARLQSLAKSCTIMRFDPKSRGRVPETNPTKFTEEFCKLAVAGWTGVTPRSLAASGVVLLDLSSLTEAEKDTPVPFTHENLIELVKNAYELDQFLQDSACDSRVFNPTKEEEEGNSESSQSGSSVPTILPADTATPTSND